MTADDLTADVLAVLLPSRPVRSYPAVVSTAADAQAWARAGGPAGAVVVADYQVAARRRGGVPWPVTPGHGLSCSLILRPTLDADHVSLLYAAAIVAVSDVFGAAPIRWPDEIRGDGDSDRDSDRDSDSDSDGGQVRAAVGIESDPGPGVIRWAIVNLFVASAEPPRGPLLAALVGAVEHRAGMAPPELLADYRNRCTTPGRRVVARLPPLGPDCPRVEGVARAIDDDGALVVDTPTGRSVAVRAEDLAILDT